MRFLLHVCRVVSLVLLSVIGTSMLMYLAPGYFADAGELDAAHASVTRTELKGMLASQASLGELLRREAGSWRDGSLGRSRQFGTPVSVLLKERAGRSARLLAAGVLIGWMMAILLAVLMGTHAGRHLHLGTTLGTSLILAAPVGVLAIACLLSQFGGPVAVLATIVAARDFKILNRSIASAWNAPYVLHAHAAGIARLKVFASHVLPNIQGELLAVAVMSFTLALSALVPLEVIFDIPGLGQLAWSAAMNRDLPVLVGVTGMMSACVGIAGCLAEQGATSEAVACA